MVARVGNVLYAPQTSGKPYTIDPELAYSTAPAPLMKGCTLARLQGVLECGTPLQLGADGLYYKAPRSYTSAGTATVTAANDTFTTSAAHGLGVGSPVQLGTLTGAAGATAGTTYYVRTVPSATTFTLSATRTGNTPGPVLDITSDGSTASVTPQFDAAKVKGFLRYGVDTDQSMIHQGNIVLAGKLKYDVIKAALGNTDLPASVLTALNAKVDYDLLILSF